MFSFCIHRLMMKKKKTQRQNKISHISYLIANGLSVFRAWVLKFTKHTILLSFHSELKDHDAQTKDVQVSFVRYESLFASFVRVYLFHIFFPPILSGVDCFHFYSLSDGIYEMTAFLLKAHCLANTKTDLLHPKNGTIVFACVCYLFGCCYCCLTSSFSWFLLRKAIKTRAHKGVCHWFAFEQCNLRFMSPC